MKPALNNCRAVRGLAVRGSCSFALRAGCEVCACAGRAACPLVPTAAGAVVAGSERRAFAVVAVEAGGAVVRFALGTSAVAGAGAVLLAVVAVLALGAAAGDWVRFACSSVWA